MHTSKFSAVAFISCLYACVSHAPIPTRTQSEHSALHPQNIPATICIEARSEKRRQELMFLTKLGLAHINLSHALTVEPNVVSAAICEPERFQLSVILPNLRFFSEAMQLEANFRRPRATCSKDTSCTADYGALRYINQNDTYIVLNPFINWRFADLAVQTEFNAYRTNPSLKNLQGLAANLEKQRPLASGDESLKILSQIAQTSSNPAGSMIYTPSLALYPVILSSLKPS